MDDPGRGAPVEDLPKTAVRRLGLVGCPFPCPPGHLSADRGPAIPLGQATSPVQNQGSAASEGEPACIPAFILNPTEEEAVIITHTDNDVRERGWFAAYQSIEAILKANPKLSQRQVAASLKLDNEKVYRAIRLLPLLGAEARGLIARLSGNSNKGNKGISELAAFQLAALGPGTGLKRGVRKEGEESQRLWPYPAIPAETQSLVLRALRVACDEYMTENQVKGLVAHIQQGRPPEEYRAKGGSAPVQPKARTPKTDTGQTPGKQEPGEPDLHSQVATAIAGHELGKKLHVPSPVINRLFPWLTRQFQRVRGLFTGLGIKDPTLSTFLALLLVLFVGSWLYHLTGRLLNRVWIGFAYSDLSPAPQGRGQALVVPSLGAGGNGGTQGGSAKLSPAPASGQAQLGQPGAATQTVPALPASTPDALSPKPNTDQAVIPAAPARAAVPQRRDLAKNPPPAVEVPPERKEEVEKVGNRAKVFALNFYGVAYLFMNDDLNSLTDSLDLDYAPDFVRAYYPLSRLDQIKRLKLYEGIELNHTPPRVIGLGKASETFLVEGVASLRSDANQKGRLLAQGPVALEVRFRPGDDGQPKVVWVKELKALPMPENLESLLNVQKQDSGEDLEKTISGAAKAVTQAAGTMDQGAEAANSVKKALGF